MVVIHSLRSLVLCVSPLVSLVIDKRNKFSHIIGLSAEYILVNCMNQHFWLIFKADKYQLLFFSPQSLIRNFLWIEVLSSKLHKQSLLTFAVDEAHCIKYC